MEATNRIIVNTAVQYVRSALTMGLMLLATRYILSSLGHSDYGIYAVVASTVFMLSAITLSLASSTQRFLSVEHGSGNKAALRDVFVNALILHLGIALLLAIVMAALEPVLMGLLTLPPDRQSASTYVYFMMLVMVLTSFATAPIRALYIARENIIYVSVVEVIDAVLKLGAALMLPYIKADSLMLYATVMMLIAVFNLLCYALYAGWRYDECSLPRRGLCQMKTIRRLTGFAVWNVYNVASATLRTQGMAVLINRFLGTLVNAAWGIAMQVSGAVGFIAGSLLNAMNPQLMKAEGAGDRQRMLFFAQKESKYAFLTLALLLSPLIVEMPSVLTFWLTDVPPLSTMFCRLLLLDFIIDQLTIGLSSANQAIGHIRTYSLLTSTVRLLTVPAAWGCLALGLAPLYFMLVSVSFTAIIGLIRLPYLQHTAGLAVRRYLKDVAASTVIPVAGTVATAYLMSLLHCGALRFILTEAVAVIVGAGLAFCLSLTREEQKWVIAKVK